MELFGAPQIPLTGTELITIHQLQNGQLVKCTMLISSLASLQNEGSSTAWATGLPTAKPDTAGIVWNDAGVISIS